MERAPRSPVLGNSEGPLKNPLGNISGKERSAWNIPAGSVAYHTSSDASLFSCSLPVLPHAELNYGDSEKSAGSPYNVKGAFDIAEASQVGNLLPGDEEELLAGIMDDFDLGDLPTQVEDLDDDFFGSGGGLELEPEAQDNILNGLSNLSLSDGVPGSISGSYASANGVGTVAGEHPYGEHPSRTLFVRNINSNVEDAELKTLFEQYGSIRTLYTACKHRGFVMISYYDIRAARTAMRALQNKPLRRRRLDIHFSIPKDNPSEKDVNQGTLVVFNLDASVSNDDLRQIFGAYGEIKEIRETPHKRHHKFIEFYDVRAAEAALKALNRSDIAGKRIKLEPSRPGGARRTLMQQMSQDMEQVGSPIAHSPTGWSTFGSPVEPPSPLHGFTQPAAINTMSGSPLPGLASILPPHLSSPGKIAPIGKDSGRKLSSSPGHVSSFLDMNSNSSGTGTLSGPQFLWGSPTIQSERANSSSWSTSALGHPFAASRHGQGNSLSGRQGSFLASHHHIGSAPSGVPLERRFGFLPESPETSYMSQVAYGGGGLSPNRGSHLMNVGGLNVGIPLSGSFTEVGSPSSRMMSLSRNGPVYFGNGSYGGMGSANFDGLSERGRSRRVESGSQVENKKQYMLDLEKIINGEDTRTTLMIKNIPNKYTSKMLLAAIDESHKGTYDFLYLPIDFKNKCNVGYAFINMVSPFHIVSFYEVFNGMKWEKFNSEKVASLAYARIQGKSALVNHFQNSSLMNEDKRCRPILFQSEGEGLDDQEFYPSSNLNICIRQPDGSYVGDSLDSPKGNVDERLEKS